MTNNQLMIKVYTNFSEGEKWLDNYQNKMPIFACILGFTNTALIPGISTAGAKPEDRKYTAIADGEFLINGVTDKPKFPLPPLDKGISPVFISRGVIEAFNIPVYLFNAGLPHPPSVKNIDLQGIPAKCVSTGNAMPLSIVKHLFQQGLNWGKKLGEKAKEENRYLILGECVVGGTTTALSLLSGLGIDAKGKVNSSHPNCNHQQKWQIVEEGLKKAELLPLKKNFNPLEIVAKVGDPMQVVVAGMALNASKYTGVTLAGGTQMLAVYALIKSLSSQFNHGDYPIIVGTTRWIAEDTTGDTVGLAKTIPDTCLIATQLDFSKSNYHQLRIYEEGYVKEGVGAGGLAIASSLAANWNSDDLINAIEKLILATIK